MAQILCKNSRWPMYACRSSAFALPSASIHCHNCKNTEPMNCRTKKSQNIWLAMAMDLSNWLTLFENAQWTRWWCHLVMNRKESWWMNIVNETKCSAITCSDLNQHFERHLCRQYTHGIHYSLVGILSLTPDECSSISIASNHCIESIPYEFTVCQWENT